VKDGKAKSGGIHGPGCLRCKASITDMEDFPESGREISVIYQKVS